MTDEAAARKVELVFVVQETGGGGYSARAMGEPIFVEGADRDELIKAVHEAINSHFPLAADRPKTILLHYVRDEIVEL